jgi:hypothetical protein
MTYSFRTLTYFIFWGCFYGLLLGAFAGTAIFPIFGTMYSVIWGTGVGAACGVLSGALAAFVHRTSFHHDTDLDAFRRRLSLGIGALTAVAAPVILYATSRGVLGDSALMQDMAPWTVLSLFAASFWGSLSSGYIASHYGSFIARLTTRREYEEEFIPQERNEVLTATRDLMRVGTPRWLYAVVAIGFAALYTVSTSRSVSYFRTPNFLELIGYLGVGAVSGALGLFVAGFYLAFGNAALLTFLKRLIFREYASHMPPTWYRRTLTAIAFVFTVAVTWWTSIFSLILACAAAAVVYRTLALPDETIDKAKRKEKNALALEDNLIDETPLLIDLERAQLQEQQS